MNRSRPERLPEGGFIELLTELMAARGVTKKMLARYLDISEAQVYAWFKTRYPSWPNLDDVVLIAEYLDDETLVLRASADRRRQCPQCKRQYSAERRYQLYCSKSCQSRAGHVREGRSKHERLVYAVNDLRETIDAMCKACEPLEVCRQPDCPIQVRGKSPFAVARPRGEPRVQFVHTGAPIPVKAARS